MEPQFKNDREILMALWHKSEAMAKNQNDFYIENVKFQSEISGKVSALSNDVLILKERKKFSIGKFFKFIFGFLISKP